MILRAIGARRMLCFTIFLLTLLVVAGTVVAVGFGRLTHLSRGTAGALVLLGLVAVAAQAVESVRRREHDLALARLRGRRGLRLMLFAVAEPCSVVLCGAAGGVLAGWLATRRIVADWLPAGTSFSLGTQEWAAVAIVTVSTLLIVVASSWRTVRAPLLEQLAAARRPRSASTVGLFLQLVLVIGAAVAIYQAHQDASSRVDWVSLVSPAVVGLAVGQLMVWLVMAVLSVVVPRSQKASFGWFLTLRRLFRRADGLAVLRLVVAAGVVFGLAASASVAAQSWRDQRARLQLGGPVSYPVRDGALRAYAAAQTADPAGRWLLPVASYVNTPDSTSRRVFVSAARWGNVVGDFFDGTQVAPLTGALQKLPAAPPVVFEHGTSVTAVVPTAFLPHAVGVDVIVEYVNDAGDVASLTLPLRAALGKNAGNGLSSVSRPLTQCRHACSVIQLAVSGSAPTPMRLESLTFAGREMLSVDSGIHLESQGGLGASREGGGLSIALPDVPIEGSGVFASFGTARTEPAVSTPHVLLDTDNGRPTVEGVDGSNRPVDIIATLPVLPFVGTSGTLLDLDRVLVGAGGSVPETMAAVIARSDTPPSVLSALRATAAVGPPTTYQGELRKLDESPRALGTRLYLLIAIFAALVALVSLLSSVTQQVRERRTEAASLRAVGVRVREIDRAYRREALVLAVCTALGTGVATWVTSSVLLRALPLVSGWVFAPPLDASPRLGWIWLTALVASGAVAVVVYVAFRGVGRSSQPRMLREDLP